MNILSNHQPELQIIFHVMSFISAISFYTTPISNSIKFLEILDFLFFIFVEGSYLMWYYMYFIKHEMSTYTISNERLGSVMFSPLRFTILFRLQTMTFAIYSDSIQCMISSFNLSGIISCLSFFRSFRRHF
jgi:hypothetical protein